MPERWIWVAFDVAHAIHDRQIAEHGGAAGLRDDALVESALVRPINLAGYGSPDVADFAAAYACGLARAHGFIDGNKRTAWVVARLFLRLNRIYLAFDPVDAVKMMEQVAAGRVDEAQLARWFRERIRPPSLSARLKSPLSAQSLHNLRRRLHLAPARGAARHRFVVLAPLADLEVLVDMGDAPGLGGGQPPAGNAEREEDRAGQRCHHMQSGQRERLVEPLPARL